MTPGSSAEAGEELALELLAAMRPGLATMPLSCGRVHPAWQGIPFPAEALVRVQGM
ncbi:hypothetical protein [Sphaerotilus sp.]|uniref:hypothetical protein n=1 Tax=Sphaerotilus sp. TaxID=2093942 RepID=UPI00286DCE9C|nr:hypothetical protein [Sphaerotilus sp.]